MNTGRRTYLAGAAAVFSGCVGGITRETVPPAEDGYPPASSERPPRRRIDTDSFPRLTVHGIDVPLAPVDVTYYWYRRREGRFADARGPRSYALSHILGAVLSPAPDGGENDPIANWPRRDRIVCYCGCPHHLSALRAAALIENGYREVYVIDEGFWEWRERGYPVAGRAINTEPAVYEINGRTDPRFAGHLVWAWHEPSGQREASAIEADGTYALDIRFTGVTMDSNVLIETPDYRVRAELRELLRGTITGAGATPIDAIR